MRYLAIWIHAHWRDLAISASVAIAVLVVLFWGRRIAGRWFSRFALSSGVSDITSIESGLRRASSLWIALIAAYAAVRLAPIQEMWRDGIGQLVLTALLLSVGIEGVVFMRRLATFAGDRFDLPEPALHVAVGVLAGAAGIVVVLGVLRIWGAETVPLLVAFVVLAALGAVALRDLAPTVVASFQVAAFKDIGKGDYIKLDSGEEGTVEDVSWRDLVIRAVDGSRVKVPHPKLVRAIVVNYGQSLGRAATPLRFQVRSHIRELTGLCAHNLRELAECLRTAPDNSIYYHTHQYLEEHQYLSPTPANAFSEWVADALGDRAVAEALAAIDVMTAPALGAVRERLVTVAEDAVRSGRDRRTAEPGHELYFLKSITFITPCPYEAKNLRELAGVVRRLSLGSLYFHLFEARLLGGALALSDISTWLRRELGEAELASSVDRLNPYDYTLEGLRSSLLSRIEARLK